MATVSEYFSGLFRGIKSLLTGMRVTWGELWSKKITAQYPENRDTLVISDRFRGELAMPHDANNEHACTACGICSMNCPNGTLRVDSEMVETEDGKKKKVLTQYNYNLGLCTFCNLCVITCPTGAIKFTNEFENAVFTRGGFELVLNKEGSKLREKAKVEKPVAPKVEKPAVKAEPKVEVAKDEVEQPTAKAVTTPVEPVTPVVDKKVADSEATPSEEKNDKE